MPDNGIADMVSLVLCLRLRNQMVAPAFSEGYSSSVTLSSSSVTGGEVTSESSGLPHLGPSLVEIAS